MNPWEHSVWWGARYVARGRTFTLHDGPAFIFSCPLCEYAYPADTDAGVRTLRRIHARTAHGWAVELLDELDADETLPRHLRKGAHHARTDLHL